MNHSKTAVLPVVCATLFLLLLVAWAITFWINSIIWDVQCGGHVKRAGDANTVGLAKKELKTVIDYLEHNGHKEGSTSVLWQTPGQDVGFWYDNLSSALKELEDLPDSATSLEKTNVLMKLRETLLDQEKDGVEVTAPSGIVIYPYNGIFFVWGWGSFVLLLIFGGIAGFFYLKP